MARVVAAAVVALAALVAVAAAGQADWDVPIFLEQCPCAACAPTQAPCPPCPCAVRVAPRAVEMTPAADEAAAAAAHGVPVVVHPTIVPSDLSAAISTNTAATAAEQKRQVTLAAVQRPCCVEACVLVCVCVHRRPRSCGKQWSTSALRLSTTLSITTKRRMSSSSCICDGVRTPLTRRLRAVLPGAVAPGCKRSRRRRRKRNGSM